MKESHHHGVNECVESSQEEEEEKEEKDKDKARKDSSSKICNIGGPNTGKENKMTMMTTMKKKKMKTTGSLVGRTI